MLVICQSYELSFICQPYTIAGTNGFVPYMSRAWIDMAYASHMVGIWHQLNFIEKKIVTVSFVRAVPQQGPNRVPILFLCEEPRSNGQNEHQIFLQIQVMV